MVIQISQYKLYFSMFCVIDIFQIKLLNRNFVLKNLVLRKCFTIYVSVYKRHPLLELKSVAKVRIIHGKTVL